MQKKKMSTEKILIIGILLVGAIALVGGVSFAFWQANVSQTIPNRITSDCLKLDIVSSGDADSFTLDNTFPLTDEEAEALEPYTFTIENLCNTNVNYRTNLEVMAVDNRLNSSFINLQVNNNAYKRLNTYTLANESYYTNQYKDDYTVQEKYEIATGNLGAKESVSYSIKLWMDKDVTMADDVMNKTFISKVTVGATLNLDAQDNTNETE